MARTDDTTRRVVFASSAGALIAAALMLAGCTKPPPALPKSVMAKGVEALPEKHPKLTDQQREKCIVCHREVPDPTGSNP